MYELDKQMQAMSQAEDVEEVEADEDRFCRARNLFILAHENDIETQTSFGQMDNLFCSMEHVMYDGTASLMFLLNQRARNN